MAEPRYDEEVLGESCMDCERPCLGWAATTEHWQQVMGEWDAGILCPLCFTVRSEALGIPCRWRAIEGDEGDERDQALSQRDRLLEGIEAHRRQLGHLLGDPEKAGPGSVTSKTHALYNLATSIRAEVNSVQQGGRDGE